MSSALFEFMPYGAPELIEGGPRRLARATTASIAGAACVFFAVLGWSVLRPAHEEIVRTVIVPYRELAAPPPLTDAVAPPPIAIVAPAAAPTMGVPVPVPDAQVAPEQTIASQQEIAQQSGTVAGGTGDQQVVVVAPPADEELPKLGEFVYVDELPELVTDAAPQYPELAREGNVEGDVLLRVLVGRNGHVLDVHVEKSMPMLDEAAVAAARRWVFKPALCNNHPVAVWIARPVRFRLAIK
jgi:periplasmic protein TonB